VIFKFLRSLINHICQLNFSFCSVKTTKPACKEPLPYKR